MVLVRTAAFVSLLFPTFIFAQATVSLKAVARNGVPITPTNHLNVDPGDIVTAEIYLSGWSNPPFDSEAGELRTYQASLDPGSVKSGSCGLIMPVGWDTALEFDPCPCDDPLYPICSPFYSPFYSCFGQNHHPEQMASIDSGAPGRSDFVFYGTQSICAVDVSTLRIRWGCTLFTKGGPVDGRCQDGPLQGRPCRAHADCLTGSCETSFQHYAGTLNLQVGDDACGTFEFKFLTSPYYTFFLADDAVYDYIPDTDGLRLTSSLECLGGLCCAGEFAPACDENICPQDCAAPDETFFGVASTCASVIPPCYEPGAPDSEPRNCIIDARIPFSPNQPVDREGFTSLTWAFPQPLNPAEDDFNDFSIQTVGGAANVAITEIVSGRGNTVTVLFSKPIPPNAWTCVEHLPTGSLRCLGSLPGDAGGGGSANVMDIFDIIDNLNGVRNPPMQLHECDIDRSGVCAPVDILYEIDLLNGVNGYPAQNGRTLPPCPSATP